MMARVQPFVQSRSTHDLPATASLARDDWQEPGRVRRAARSGHLALPTAGLAPGYLQANIVIVPADVADAFLRYCVGNPKPCPLVGIGKPGDPGLPALGADLDIRSDLPSYRVFRDGEPAGDVPDIADLWRDDLVTFALGCSFSFEESLLAEGLPVRHIAAGSNVPMYATNRDTVPSGPFRGPLVVSMRAMPPAAAIRAVILSDRQPLAHGAPVYLGDPAGLGITNIDAPDFGDPPHIEPGDIPVFWACGVTPQAALREARLPFAITHAPGHMLVTDVRAAGQTTIPQTV